MLSFIYVCCLFFPVLIIDTVLQLYSVFLSVVGFPFDSGDGSNFAVNPKLLITYPSNRKMKKKVFLLSLHEKLQLSF